MCRHSATIDAFCSMVEPGPVDGDEASVLMQQVLIAAAAAAAAAAV
jgi:hypothetical protein